MLPADHHDYPGRAFWRPAAGLGHGNGAELRQPLGIAIVGGLIVSQMLTLFTTPVVYLYLERCAGRSPATPGTSQASGSAAHGERRLMVPQTLEVLAILANLYRSHRLRKYRFRLLFGLQKRYFRRTSHSEHIPRKLANFASPSLVCVCPRGVRPSGLQAGLLPGPSDAHRKPARSKSLQSLGEVTVAATVRR